VISSKLTLYFLSGLGADKKAFSFLEIDKRFEKNYAEWIKPLKNEKMADYAKHMIDTYHIQDGDILIGLSFGGMMAIEINKIINLKQVILVSSTATTGGLSSSLRNFGRLGLTNLLPKHILNKPNPGNYYVFGAKTKDEQEKLDLFISEGDVDINYWSIGQLVRWRNKTKPDNVVIINGSVDKIFPFKKVKPDYLIEGGTHLMVYNKAKEVSEIINRILQNFKT